MNSRCTFFLRPGAATRAAALAQEGQLMLCDKCRGAADRRRRGYPKDFEHDERDGGMMRDENSASPWNDRVQPARRRAWESLAPTEISRLGESIGNPGRSFEALEDVPARIHCRARSSPPNSGSGSWSGCSPPQFGRGQPPCFLMSSGPTSLTHEPSSGDLALGGCHKTIPPSMKF